MLKKNVGSLDRTLRIIIGIGLIAGFFLNADAAYRGLYLLGIVPLLTGLIGSCPPYALLGLNTCKMKG